jgi:hypothetical protein
MIDRQLITLESVTIRARAAFALSIAERAFRAGATANEEGYAAALDAIDIAWQWIGGKHIPGYELYSRLDGGDDTGLLIWSQVAVSDAPPDGQIAKTGSWHALVNAVAYICWRAYQLDGEEYVPQAIESVDESTIREVLTSAENSKHLDWAYVNRVKTYLSARYATTNQDELGPPISREEVKSV